MTVGELVKELARFDFSTAVVIHMYESDGLGDPLMGPVDRIAVEQDDNDHSVVVVIEGGEA